ncbi:HelD family protein [Saccharothrix syringae]|uniref:AAA family ATPase n=1 Tax=Saccharothrix syringae TaxID=103733 RepID=A0A1X9WEN8_SACSY|nr:ATP-binding domain-containing protein [Saccharothrix syringae]ARS01483.1 NcmJ [Saccharothrix syringae]QFZ19283.1 AAA family ATPase [Saccharothrix syringae]
MHESDEGQVEPEIRAERDYMDACRAQLARMRDEVRTMLDTGAGEGEDVVDKYFNHVLRQFRRQVVEELVDLKGVPLFFGRLEYPAREIYDDAGDEVRRQGRPTHTPTEDRVYVGRRGVRDDDGEPMVIDWRAALSRAFYEADRRNPMGVRVRRRYGFDHDGVLTAFEDEPVDRPAGTDGAVGTDGAGGLLAAEIERPRKGPMRDIVATIQPEQMSLVRAPLDRTLCVQGAPGTGKTAVGLHRLAYLLYAERDRLRKDGGVAVIGPNRSFLSYIRNVLPALGEVQVAQTTIDELIDPGVAVGRVDDPAAARVKGDVRMAEVLRRHLWARIRPLEEAVEVKHQHRTWRLFPDELADEVAAVVDRGTDYGTGREVLAARLAHLVLRQMERAGNSSVTSAQLRRNGAINRAVGRMWPAIDAARAVFELLTDEEQLARAADGVLSPDEQRAVLVTPRPRNARAMRWTSLDLALLDEVRSLVERPARLGHVVVDEAQDLSPMQFRAIARRLAGSGTVLGDLAQATSPSAVRDWTEVLAHLGRPDGHVEELTRGYRVPAQIIDFAARILPHIAPGLAGPASFRHTADALHVTGTTPRDRTATVVGICLTALEGEGSIGLIAADEHVPALHRALADHDVPHVVLGDDDVDMEAERLNLVPVSLGKGLEFDTVVVVEPMAIVAAEERGLQRLYVALTRAVSELHVVHSEPLPAPLAQQPALV